MKRFLLEAALDAWSVLLPVTCAGCGVDDRGLCADCRRALEPSLRVVRLADGTAVTSAVRYEGVARRTILGFKEHGRTDVARALARPLAMAIVAATSGRVELVAVQPGILSASRLRPDRRARAQGRARADGRGARAVGGEKRAEIARQAGPRAQSRGLAARNDRARWAPVRARRRRADDGCNPHRGGSGAARGGCRGGLGCHSRRHAEAIRPFPGHAKTNQ
jgi:hypothetical protein